MPKFSGIAYALTVGAIICTFAMPLSAQENSELQRVEAPRTSASQDYTDLARKSRIKTNIDYEAQNSSPSPSQPRRVNINAPDVNVYLILLAFVIAIFVFLKFGGSGALLRQVPKKVEKRHVVAPQSWGVQSDFTELDKKSWLEKLANTQDYREALIEMLRYSLLQGGLETNTIFLRSDTERDASARLPENWKNKYGLDKLLRQAELAHYGGREVKTEQFNEALEICRSVFSNERKQA